MPTNNGEHLSEVSVDVLVHRCKIPRIAGVGIAAVEKDERRLWVCLDDRLHVRRRGQREGNVGITKASVELDWMKIPLRSDKVQPWIDVHSPGLLNSAATDKAVQTTKSFSALSAKRNTSDPPPSFHEEIVAATLLSTSDKSSGLTDTLRPAR